MKSTDFIVESIGEDADEMHRDHEVQMARADCYHAAKYAIELHKMLHKVSEEQGLEGWVSEKLTLACDYLRTVHEHMDHANAMQQADVLPAFTFEDAEAALAQNLSEINPHRYDSDEDYYNDLNGSGSGSGDSGDSDEDEPEDEEEPESHYEKHVRVHGLGEEADAGQIPSLSRTQYGLIRKLRSAIQYKGQNVPITQRVKFDQSEIQQLDNLFRLAAPGDAQGVAILKKAAQGYGQFDPSQKEMIDKTFNDLLKAPLRDPGLAGQGASYSGPGVGGDVDQDAFAQGFQQAFTQGRTPPNGQTPPPSPQGPTPPPAPGTMANPIRQPGRFMGPAVMASPRLKEGEVVNFPSKKKPRVDDVGIVRRTPKTQPNITAPKGNITPLKQKGVMTGKTLHSIYETEDEELFGHSEKGEMFKAVRGMRRGGESTGSSANGLVRTTYQQLVNTFGEPLWGPNDESGDGKVSCYWAITFGDKNRTVATIYDWKEGGTTPMGEYDWHIGGKHGSRATDFVEAALKFSGHGSNPDWVAEEGKGLWANIHAKQERIKHGSNERMRKPGSKGAPTAQDFKDSASKKQVSEMTAGGTGAGGFATGPTAGGNFKKTTGVPKKLKNPVKRTTPQVGKGIY